MENRITLTKLEKYFKITERALIEIKSKIVKEEEAKEIISMVENYLSDAKYFLRKKDYVNSFAALNYAYGWIDCGVRLGIFDVKDNQLFTLK
ncbi:MAG: DUF357 domain-containing protein [Candidatus Pacearchaeota archaeon]